MQSHTLIFNLTSPQWIATDFKDKMEKKFLICGILALSACIFSSCDEDEETGSNEKVSQVKRLISSTFQTKAMDSETKEHVTIIQDFNYEYDAEGRLVKISDNIKDYKEVFDYKRLVKTSVLDGTDIEIGKLNANGTIVSDSAVNGNYQKEYSYDESGHINYSSSLFIKDEENSNRYSYSYTWTDGNIVSCEMKDGGVHNGAPMELGVFDYKYEYVNETVTTPIENKTGLVFLFDSVLNFSPAYGAGTKNLPVKVNGQNIQWTLEDGYPVKVVTDNATATFMWK